MTRYGTRLGALLYWTALCIEGVLGIALIAAIVGAVAAWADPSALAAVSLRVDGAPIDPAAPGGFLAAMVFLATMVAIAGYAAHQLRRLLGTLKAGDPFAAANVRRLQMIAAAMAGLAIIGSIGALAMPAGMFSGVDRPPHGVDVEGLFAALVVLALAEIFREGRRLREESEGTI